MDGGALQRVKSYQWPSGHVAHLTEGQQGALKEFKKLCAEKGYYSPGDDHSPSSHDDETLLRYLRARKFIPREAFIQLKDTEDWRQENQLGKLYETIDIEEYDQARRLYPQWTGRRDRRGIPLYVYEIRKVDAKEVLAYATSKDSRKLSTNAKLPWKMVKLFALYENLCRFVLPLCSAIPDRPNPETPISQSNNIVDLTGVGIGKLWNLKTHMSDASTLATAYYPETLDRIFVIGAPSYFPTVWKWVQGWFDPITVSKIFILSSREMASTLEKYVDLDNIPTRYGGNLEWKFGDMPFLEPEIADSMKWKEDIREKGHHTLPIGPIKLEYDAEGDLISTAIGTENGKPRCRQIAGLKPQPGVARLALSAGRIQSIEPNNLTSTPIATSNGHPPGPASQSQDMNTDPNLNIGKDPHSALPTSSRAGTYTVPYTDYEKDIASDGRTGTSSTRYQQQTGTHAEGQLAETTPQVQRSGLEDRPAVMDPNTVGQAPKERFTPGDQEAQPSVLDQAKDLAGQAVEQAKALPGTVMSAVGMGEKKEEVGEVQEVRKEDPAVDQMAGSNVEEFLRSTTASQARTSAG